MSYSPGVDVRRCSPSGVIYLSVGQTHQCVLVITRGVIPADALCPWGLTPWGLRIQSSSFMIVLHWYYSCTLTNQQQNVLIWHFSRFKCVVVDIYHHGDSVGASCEIVRETFGPMVLSFPSRGILASHLFVMFSYFYIQLAPKSQQVLIPFNQRYANELWWEHNKEVSLSASLSDGGMNLTSLVKSSHLEINIVFCLINTAFPDLLVRCKNSDTHPCEKVLYF